MQLPTLSALRREDVDAGQGETVPTQLHEHAPDAPAKDGQAEGEATLRLLKGCVEAMSLIQAKCESLEAELNLKLDVGVRERADLRGALRAAEAALAEAVQHRQDTDQRLDRMETAAKENARQFADDLASARAEAANWRMRAETDSMAFELLDGRITALETGLSARLERTTRDLAESETSNVQLRSRADDDGARATELATQLRNVEATIADQRSRISCLQSKLATATYAIRLEHLSKSMDEIGTTERDILDLQKFARVG